MAISAKTKVLIVAAFGFFLCASGVFMYLWMPGYINKRIAQKMALNEGSESFENWRKTPIPIYLSVFLFNVTNPKEYTNGIEKPKLQQMGPYTFLQFREKSIIGWDDEMDTVTFTQVKRFYFDESTSVGSLSDNITLLNVPLAGLAEKVKGMKKSVKFGINMVMAINKADPFVYRTVGEVLFDGYEDALFKALGEMQDTELLPNNSFCLFQGQNDTNDGVYVVNRGNKNIEMFNNIEEWNYTSILDYWGTTSCNEIRGTDGSMFPPNVKPEDKVNMFTTELCRSAYMEYVNTVVTRGIRNLRYSPSDDMLASPRISDENRCYCLENDTSSCLGSGVLNISICKRGAPIIISLPHFLDADQEYKDAVEGLSSDETIHRTYMDIEPLTGIVMNASKKLQINAFVNRVPKLTGYNRLNSTIFPIMWVNETAAINVESAAKFKRQLQTPILIGKAAQFGMMGTGSFIVLCTMGYLAFVFRKKRQPQSNGVSKVPMEEMNLKGPANEKLLHNNSHRT